jgi:Protein of unknown function (DUF1592)/Protein of unknown function (DUF1588)/Protein of unknown function (DUF1595)/Protein of unknown function (DUF1587)/Protein of unknown function (DUF1585)
MKRLCQGVLLVVLVSCQGVVGLVNGASEAGSGAPGASPPAPTGPGTGGVPTLPQAGEPCTANDLTLRRLSNGELTSSYTDVLGVTTAYANQLPQSTRGSVFDNNRRSQSVDVAMVTKYLYDVVEPAVDEALRLDAQAGTKRLLTCDLSAAGCVSSIVTKVGLKAWRRPLEPSEVSEVLNVAAEAGTLNEPPLEGLRWALVTLFLSPHFWFRSEGGPGPAAPLGAYALASRLSFFLAGTTPDDELLSDAQSGALVSPAGYEKAVSRLLSGQRAATHWTQNIGNQWFGVRVAAPPTLEAGRYRNYVDALPSMRAETEAFLKLVYDSKAPVTDLIVANYTVADEKLRAFYQVQGGQGMQRIDLPTGRGAGVLTQPYLAASNHKAANPIFRGVWVLGRLMCEDLMVPVNVPALPTEADQDNLPLAERLKKHSASPACAGCHSRIDPIGLSMENLDAAAQMRTVDDFGKPIDASATLPNGKRVNGVRELATSLRDDGSFVTCAVKRMHGFALGVPLPALHEGQLKTFEAEFRKGDTSVSSLMRAVAMDPSFKTVCAAQLQ